MKYHCHTHAVDFDVVASATASDDVKHKTRAMDCPLCLAEKLVAATIKLENLKDSLKEIAKQRDVLAAAISVKQCLQVTGAAE